jgi:putative ABC transport system permease protein
MSLWKIAWRSIQQRSLASALTAFAMGLGVALVASVLVIHGVIDQSFRRGAQGYDLIVGAKGESIQLVLNTVFHLGQAPESIPYRYYEELKEGRFSAAVETAVPVAMGHAYKGFPVIATTPDMFDRLKYLGDREYKFVDGHNFDVNKPFSGVVGSVAARKLHVKVGDMIQPTHPGQDIAGDAKDSDHEPIEIVGILEHTGTPNDRAIFMNLEGFYQFGCHQAGPGTVRQYLKAKDSGKDEKAEPSPHAKDADGHDDHANHADKKEAGHDHAAEGHEEAHDHAAGEADHDPKECHDPNCKHHHHPVAHEDRKLSAVLVCTNQDNQVLGMQMRNVINEENDAQAVAPTEIIAQLFDGIIGNIQKVLVILAALVVVVAGIGILVSIYNSMSDRRHEIAVMRALGASRVLVGTVILLESILLSLGGGVFGVLLGHGLIGILGPTIAEHTNVLVHAWQFQWNELMLIPGLVVLASLVGYVPAAVAYRTDVAKSLAANQ